MAQASSPSKLGECFVNNYSVADQLKATEAKYVFKCVTAYHEEELIEQKLYVVGFYNGSYCCFAPGGLNGDVRPGRFFSGEVVSNRVSIFITLS